jgi:hypothetical protein
MQYNESREVRYNTAALEPQVYCPRQFTWRLACAVVVLARLVTAWFMQRDGTQAFAV